MFFRIALAGALGAAALAYATIPARVAEYIHHDTVHEWDDFGIFFRTATCLARGQCDPYPSIPRQFPNLNPPHFHWLLLPFTGLDVEPASRIWLLLSAASVTWSVIRIFGALNIAASPVGTLGIVLAGLVSSLSWGIVTYGQVYAILMWPTTEAWLAARTGRAHVAVVIIALVATVKPIYVLPLAWLIYRTPSALTAAAGAMLTVELIGVMEFGLDAYRGWLRHLSMVSTAGHWADGSIVSMLGRMFSPTPWMMPLADAPFLIRPLWGVLAAVLVVDLWRWSRRSPIDAGWLGVLAAMLLLSPRAWMFSSWPLIGPAIAVAQQTQWRSAGIVLAAGLLLLPIELTWAGQPNAALTLLNGSIYTWAWCCLYAAARRSATVTAANRQMRPHVLAEEMTTLASTP